MKRWLVVAGIGVGLIVVVWYLFMSSRTGSAPSTQSVGGVTIPADVQTAMLHSPTGDPTVTGVATSQFVDVIFVHGMSATLPDLPVGQLYAGWLVKAADPTRPLPTGKFTKDAAGWTLNFSSPIDQSGYDGVLVTVQTGENQAPGAVVLTGSFQ